MTESAVLTFGSNPETSRRRLSRRKNLRRLTPVDMLLEGASETGLLKERSDL
jgi:hypothetical protein